MNAYGTVRAAIINLFREAIAVEIPPDALCFRCKYAEISTAIALNRREDAEAWAGALSAHLIDSPSVAYGEPLIDTILCTGGHLCFVLTKRFYNAAVKRVIASYPFPPLIPNPSGTAQYACDRMLMLARKGGSGCPDNPLARRALWLAFGIPEAAVCPRRLRSRLNEAAEALLAFPRSVAPKMRPHLANESGEAADCAARLLWLGLNNPAAQAR